ncbi:hypothetical protein Tco_0708783 [Tanacetum coccineum]
MHISSKSSAKNKQILVVADNASVRADEMPRGSIDPDHNIYIPEVYQILNTYSETPDAPPILNIHHQRFDDGHGKNKKSIPIVDATGNKPTYYCFKSTVDDGTATISIICFSDEAYTLTKDYNQVLAEIEHKDPYQLPLSLKALQVFDLKGLPLPEPSVEPLKEVPNTDESSANKKLKQED